VTGLSRPADLPADVYRVIGADDRIRGVELTGSRAADRAGPLSDWDFVVHTASFEDVRPAMPRLVRPLRPIVAQWDRLSRSWCFMLVLAGPVKVDLIFAQPHPALPPWEVSESTLGQLDDHFWDWALWLRSKELAGNASVVDAELHKLHEHLLGPLGLPRAPASVRSAVADYRAARAGWERRLRVRVLRAAEDAVSAVLG
jgi:hypothetical protein